MIRALRRFLRGLVSLWDKYNTDLTLVFTLKRSHLHYSDLILLLLSFVLLVNDLQNLRLRYL